MYLLRRLELPIGLRAKRQSAKKDVCFAHGILDFHFLLIFVFVHGSIWCCLQFGYFDLNVNPLISLGNFYKFRSIGVLWQDSINKKHSNSLILTKLRLGFEPRVLNLILKWCAMKGRKTTQISWILEWRSSMYKRQPRKKTLMFERYNLANSMEQGIVIFQIDF
jgi:hypothetical protein